jgi:DNA-binding beta-propeller fold protein YncE
MKRIILVVALVLASSASAGPSGGTWVALVTAERQNELVAVELSTGKVVRRVSLPPDPQNVASSFRMTAVVSTRAGAVTLIDPRARVQKVFRGLDDPHIVVVNRGKDLAYVTADGSGELIVIDMMARRIIGRTFVGKGAHHMALRPSGGHRLWIALGERASRIAIVDVFHRAKPRVLRYFSPGFAVHDLAYGPDGRDVWLTSAVDDLVRVVDARTGRRMFDVRGGPAPQHVAFTHGFGFVTSGYGSQIIKVNPRNGRILASRSTPYGSFNLATVDRRMVVTTSLLNGQVTEFDLRLRRLRTVKAATAARAVAIALWP